MSARCASRRAGASPGFRSSYAARSLHLQPGAGKRLAPAARLRSRLPPRPRGRCLGQAPRARLDHRRAVDLREPGGLVGMRLDAAAADLLRALRRLVHVRASTLATAAGSPLLHKAGAARRPRRPRRARLPRRRHGWLCVFREARLDRRVSQLGDASGRHGPGGRAEDTGWQAVRGLLRALCGPLLPGDRQHPSRTGPAPAVSPLPPRGAQPVRLTASCALIALIVLCLAWELWLAPLRAGGSLVALKALPLVLAAPGILGGRRYTYQWSGMLVLGYFAEGVTRAWAERGVSQSLALGEILLSVIFFAAAVSYARRTRAGA